MKPDWDRLYSDETKFFPRLLQFGDVADPRFKYGINVNMEHSLYFWFPFSTGNKQIEPVTMANVAFSEDNIEGRPALILTLLNNNLKNLFDDLIGSLVLQTREQGNNATKFGFIALCNEWFELFNPLASQLSKAEIQGIFAEVYFLKYLLITSGSAFNEILGSWKGPFGKGHDFELGVNLFEIKSRMENIPLVHISSEYQLDFLNGQNLFLVVCEFANQPGDGISVGALILETASILRTQTNVNMTLFWAALGKVRLTFSNLNDYNEYLFTLKTVTSYNCINPDFPAIRRSTIPNAVRNVKYELALNVLSVFEQSDLTPFI